MTQVAISNAPKYAKHVTAGLEWITASASEFKLQKKRMASSDIAWLTLAGSNPATKEMINYGQIDKAWLPKEGRSVSLAAWLAETFKTGTIFAVEQVDEGSDGGEPRYWFCAVIDGQVVTGSDVVENWDTVQDLVRSNLEILDDPAIGYIGKQAHLLPSREGEDNTPALAEVLNKGAFKKALLSQAVDSKAPLIIAAALVVTSVLAGGGYWWYHASSQEREAAERAAKARQNQIVRAQQEYQGLLQDLAQMSHAGRTLNAMWFDAIMTTPARIGGWKIDTFTCEAGACNFTYLNSDLTLPAELKLRLGAMCDSLTIQIDGLGAQCTRTYKTAPIVGGDNSEETPQVGEADIVAIALTAPLINNLQADLMRIGRLGQGASYAINDPIAVPFPGSRYLPTSRDFKHGEWAATFKIRDYQAILTSMNRYTGVALDKLEATWGSGVVELQGRYLTVDRTEDLAAK